MKNACLLIGLLFSGITIAQIEIKNDLVQTDNGFIKFSNTPSSNDHIDYTEYDAERKPKRKYTCLFLGKKFNGKEVYTYLKDKELIYDGLYVEFYPSGSPKRSYTYNQGVREKHELYYYETGGVKKEVFTFEESEVTKTYSAEGILQKEVTTRGKTQKLEKLYYPDVKLKSEAMYNDGKLNGALKLYNPDSTLQRIEVFQSNLSVDCRCYENRQPVTCLPLIDSLYFEKLSTQTIDSLYLLLRQYVCENDSVFKFSFIGQPNQPITDFELSSHENDSLNHKLFTFVEKHSWPNELQQGKPIPTNYQFVINPYQPYPFMRRTNDPIFTSNTTYILANVEPNEKMPEFPGGVDAMYIFLRNNIRYPQHAMVNHITGRVYIQFTVCTDGSLCDYKVVRGLDPSLEREAIRVISTMPKWKPAEQYGKPVSTLFTLPILFSLGEN